VHPTERVLSIAAVTLAVALLALPAPAPGQVCVGDCNGDRQVMVDELVNGVNIAAGRSMLDTCAVFDLDGDGAVLIHELIAAVGRLLEGCPALAYPRDDELRLNQIQVLGSHNSFHMIGDQAWLDLIGGFAIVWGYDHPPLTEQFETQGIRQIELDVFYDPAGGLYASPYALRFVTNDPNARLLELEAPGFKVLHVQDVDYRSVCPTFVACLEEVKDWSDAHPWHMPMMILVEAKDDAFPDPEHRYVVPLPIGAAELDALDGEIRSVFPPERLITPDDVRGTHATLRDAIQTDGWPTLGESRGKVLFCLDNEGKRGAYLQGHPSLQGRVMFTSSPADAPEAAFRKLNDPVGDFDEIQAAVAARLVVRTRADADTVEARNNDTGPRDMAIASGAQWVSTDYPVPDPRIGTPYMVEIPMGMPARCNPISAPANCTPLDIENPEHLTE
jgi:hypothetical protein